MLIFYEKYNFVTFFMKIFRLRNFFFFITKNCLNNFFLNNSTRFEIIYTETYGKHTHLAKYLICLKNLLIKIV